MKTIAIILSAGLGTRLKPLTNNLPKSLVKVNQKCIIDYLLDSLSLVNLEKIIVVVGFRSNMFDKSHSIIDLVENKKYETTNNMYSLSLAFQHLKSNNIEYDKLLLMNGDMIFSNDIIKQMYYSDHSNLIACEVGSYLQESMKITVGSNGFITGISKSIPKHLSYGTSIDLYKLSKSSAQALSLEINDILDNSQNQWTEVAIDNLIKTGGYQTIPLNIAGLLWCEIDNMIDFKNAEIIFKSTLGISEIREKKLFIFDYDGTLALNHTPTPNTINFLKLLSLENKRVILISNNSSRGIDEFKDTATKDLEFAFDTSQIFTSTMTTIHYLKKNDYNSVYSIGTTNFIADLKKAGIKTLNHIEDFQILRDNYPDVVIIAFDTELTYQKLKLACLLIQHGIPYIATHEDLVCPTTFGMIADAGAILEMVRTTTKKEPNAILGKPHPNFIKIIADEFNIQPKEMVLFGDRLYTDIAMAKITDILACVVLTGETKIADILETDFTPDFVFQNFTDVLKHW